MTKTYKIGELARITKATTRTLRYYEELDLLEPVRNEAGQRLYSDKTFQRLELINELKAGGFSLLEIKELFDSWRSHQTGADAAAASMVLLEQKIREISELQEKLTKLNGELKEMVKYLFSCKSCVARPTIESCSTCDHHVDKKPDPLLLTILNKG